MKYFWKTCVKVLCDTVNCWAELLTRFFSCLLALVWRCWKPWFSGRPKDRSSLDCYVNTWKTAILHSCSGELPGTRANQLNGKENVWPRATEVWGLYDIIVKANLSWQAQKSDTCWVRLGDPHIIALHAESQWRYRNKPRSHIIFETCRQTLKYK